MILSIVIQSLLVINLITLLLRSLAVVCNKLLYTALFSEKEKGNLVKEVMTMSSFEHVNLMRLIGVCFDADMPQLIMPFMDKGSVLEYVRTNKEKLMQDVCILSRYCV